MVALPEKTIDDILKELDLWEGELDLLNRLSKWPKKDLAKWLLFHLMAKGGMAKHVPHILLPALFEEYYDGLVVFAKLIEREIYASQQSKSLGTLRN